MKNWYESKALWAAIGLTIMGAVNIAKGGDYEETIKLFLVALGITGIRMGTRRIK